MISDKELIEMLEMLQEKHGIDTEKSRAAIQQAREDLGVDDVGAVIDEILKEYDNGKI
tara:strand:+ start:1772 stop:1945 length:174 start_codon:yes stop_codon:yes gene_type:complete